MADAIEVDDSALTDDQVAEVDALVEEELAARVALADALGWDWEAAPGVPSVDAVVGDVIAAMDARGFKIVRTSDVSSAGGDS